ncbi:hypothetical protein L6452_08782 [Arctium lappa]|uniref:Uncharacterized protein n=1 Tax=Arctium lappa TaxID=4217 RepID=A0ACB9DJ90_ARCLA|nr:hypothetical protein L6452_08782 [Arctium lappa]
MNRRRVGGDTRRLGTNRRRVGGDTRRLGTDRRRVGGERGDTRRLGTDRRRVGGERGDRRRPQAALTLKQGRDIPIYWYTTLKMMNWGEDFQLYHNSNDEDDNLHSNKAPEACEISQSSAFSTDMVSRLGVGPSNPMKS